jgi:two-component system, cell cycle sensor histidine kinase and response regulator CckA
MKSKVTTPYPRPFPFIRFRLVTILAWTAVAIGCMVWEYNESREFLSSNARAMAKASIEKDLVLRRWAAMHGGVYVPVTGRTSPNPYLNVPERDIVTPSGRRLTLMNPAYLTRQIFEISRSSGNAPQGHITSLKPIRPENAPDAWEAKALASFEKGVPEFGEFRKIDGRTYYRFICSLRTEKTCLSCHAAQGYREGDVRGGISVSMPVAELAGAVARNNAADELLIIAVWLTGLAGIWFGFRKIGDSTAALVVERNNLTSIFDAAPVSMLLIDDRMEVVRVNRAMERNFGRAFDDMADRSRGGVLSCVNAYADPRGCGSAPECGCCTLNHAIRQGADPGVSSTGEACVMTAGPEGGAPLWVNYGVEPVLLDGRRFVTLSLVDITFRTRSEEALRESELRYRLMVEALPALVFRVSPDGRIRFHDNKIEELCGYAKEEFDSGRMNLLDLVKEEDRAKVSLAFKDTVNQGGQMSIEFRICTSAGKQAWLFARARCAPDVEGNSPGVIGVIIDQTEQKQLEERYLHAQKMEAVGRLAGGIAHDFNNLLTVIIGYADILRHSGGENTVVKGAATRIISASDKAASLIRQLLMFSRKQIFSPVLLNLSQVVSDFESMMCRLIDQDVMLLTDCTPAPCLVLADKGQMEQVLMNLAVNASDAMPSGGTLNITTSTIDLDATISRLVGKDIARGPYVLLTVSDTGVGMDQETISQIFDPFFTTKEVGKGTGLGLATVHGIVKQCGGGIRVYSELGKGTTFRIYLPMFRGEGALHTPPAQNSAIRNGKGCILLVEDNDAIRNMASEFLRDRGYSVLTAASGEDALNVWGEHGGSVHLLITDMVMPGMDGYSLMQRMLSRGGDLKVLFMSGYTEHSQLRKEVVNNEASFLQKPFTMDMLTDKVSELLRQGE